VAEPQPRGLQAIAGFEAIKGALALAASLGLLGLLHHDLHQLAASLISHVGLDPGARYPAQLLRGVDQLRASGGGTLWLAAWGYSLLRFAEAYGLWHARPWGAWLGAVSGLLYVPFELRHLTQRPSWMGAAVLVFNLAIVAFLAWQLVRRRADTQEPSA
jgi:uncharacterized membrane protein (DUF2068 family)